MLAFFRKYQRYLYLLVTVVIVISFSFFGTYSTLGADNIREAIAFKAVDGTNVPRSELDEMAGFIGTDINDSRLYGGAWGPNFLNDGVITKDFLATGLAEILMMAYVPDFKTDWDLRLRKEKTYTPYTNPSAKFVSARSAWSYFAPEMVKELVTIQKSNNPTDPDLLHAKVRLFLNQVQFSPAMLMQVIKYQQEQYKQFVQPDPNLNASDLFLFGYHNLDDWFGPKFVRLISQFIINSSIIAEQRGYDVSKDEALADLLQRSEQSFKDNKNNPHIGVKSSSDYFQEQLRRLNMDQTHAIKVWRQVLLFRRLFHDLGNSVFVDTLGYQQFNQYALQMVGGDLYAMPQDLRFARITDLQKFETYLSYVAKKGSPLELPTTYLSADDVAKKHPELVQQVYKLVVAAVDIKSLEARVGLRETWDWETSDANWKKLKDMYPELGMKKADSKEDRLAALDTLDGVSRSKADQYARSQIVEEHPDWIKEALLTAPNETITVGLRSKGGEFPFKGIEDRDAFIKALDQAPLNDQDSKLAAWKGGDVSYYQVKVLERSPAKEILTFADANRDGTLEKLLTDNLEINYVKIRSGNPDKFQNADKSWKPLAEVRSDVAEDQFKTVLDAIKKDYLSLNKESEEKLTNDKLASLRFYKYMRDTLTTLQKDPAKAKDLAIEQNEDEENEDELTKLNDQWKLVLKQEEVTRGDTSGAVDVDALLRLKPNNWSEVEAPANGNIHFMYVTKEGVKEAPEALKEQVERARWILSTDAQQRLMYQLLQVIQAKKAISFDYMTPSQPTMESEG